MIADPHWLRRQGPWPKGSRATPDLSTADVRGPEAEEPTRPISVFEIDGPYALTRVYFGSPFPTNRAVERAQQQLNRLQLPPACPELPGKGSLVSTFSARSGAPRSVVHVSGTMPFRSKSGAYRVGSEVIDVW